MKSARFITLSGLGLLTLSLTGAVKAQTFSPNNLVVRVVGDGSARAHQRLHRNVPERIHDRRNRHRNHLYVPRYVHLRRSCP